jgi:hypothetical protein
MFFLLPSREDNEDVLELLEFDLIDNGEFISDEECSESDDDEDVEDNEINDLEPSNKDDLVAVGLSILLKIYMCFKKKINFFLKI